MAWGYFQQGRKVDAEQALRKLALVGELPPRALFLQGAVAAERNDNVTAKELYERGLAAGGEDYRIRIVLGEMAEEDEDVEEAEKQYLAAERAYPGFPEEELAAELRLAKLYEREDREDERFAALERWIRWESDNYGVRMRLAEHHAKAGRHERAVKSTCSRTRSIRSGASCTATGRRAWWLPRHSEAARERRVTRLVPPGLDPEDGEPLADKARAELLGREALALFEAGSVKQAAKARAPTRRSRSTKARTTPKRCSSASRRVPERESGGIEQVSARRPRRWRAQSHGQPAWAQRHSACSVAFVGRVPAGFPIPARRPRLVYAMP